MEASQHSLLAACITLHSTNPTLAIVPQHGAGLWNGWGVSQARNQQKQAASTLKMEALYSLKHQAVSKLHSIVVQPDHTVQGDHFLISNLKEGVMP
jgi:hypothetical protein